MGILKNTIKDKSIIRVLGYSANRYLGTCPSGHTLKGDNIFYHSELG